MIRSTLIYKKIKLSYIKEIKSYKDLISILKNKENSFALDYTGNSITEIVIKLIFYNLFYEIFYTNLLSVLVILFHNVLKLYEPKINNLLRDFL